MDRKEEWIDRSIRYTKNEMKLQEEQKTLEHSSPTTNKLEKWTVSDVISWLENKQQHKFIFLFQKHHVTGTDLVNLSLPFLEDYEHISSSERESLLSEIYQLLNPGQVHASEEDLTKLRSPVEKKKYFAAIEVATVKSSTLPRSSSVVVLPTHASSKTLSTRNSPLLKPRHRSESGADNNGKLTHFFSSLPDHKKRKTVPMTYTSSPSSLSLYQSLQQSGPNSVKCVQLPLLHYGDVTMAIDADGHVTFDTVPDSMSTSLRVGDRVLEINGHVVHPALKDPKASLKAMLKFKAPATLVILTKHVQLGEEPDMEKKWDQLHDMLVEMRDDPTYTQSDQNFTQSDLSSLPTDQQEYLAHTGKLQEEIQCLQEKVLEQQKLREKLQGDLELKEAALHDLEMSRDKALDRLKDSRSSGKFKSTKETLGGKEYYNLTMNTLNLEDASKEEVLESLKEIVTEASRQKWYLDRLISLVIEESPWLLDEVDSEFDHLALTSDSEEFC